MALTVQREIERLNTRIKELQNQLKNRDSVSMMPSPPNTSSAPSPRNLDPMEEHRGGQKQWEGIWTTRLPCQQTQLHGPSSAFHFLSRLGSHIGLALQVPHVECQLQPSTASRFFASPVTPKTNYSDYFGDYPFNDPVIGENLSRAQEDYFLGLFWSTYHCTTPILDELEFREHYESLWATSGTVRKPSPLVDIILALCMQYGMTFIPRNDANQTSGMKVDSNDSTIAGRGFFHRCQTLLHSQLETPSLSTLQCCIFTAIYLRDASFVNLAHNSLATAIQAAHVLGLHQEPLGYLSRAQKELRKRIWWSIFTLESKACMALGRPRLSHVSQVKCSLPADDRELGLLSGPNFASASSYEDISWLSYHVQSVKLIAAARAVHIAFEGKCAQVLDANAANSIYDDAKSLETLAGFLSESLQCIRSWVENVPDSLKTQRRGGGKPFSTDRTTLEVDLVVPQWLQRQRLLLEILYHNLIMNLYRPFICFSSPSSSSTPLADSNSISCVNHAIANTSIIHQILTTMDILDGWHESYQFQWNATLSMIGFIFAYPVRPATPSARRTVNNAIAVFDIFKDNFAVAASATNITRDLASKADIFIDRFRTGLISPPQQTPVPLPPPIHSLEGTSIDSNISLDLINNIEVDDVGNPIAIPHHPFSTSMEMAFPIGSFSGFEWPISGSSGVTGTIWPQYINE